MRSAAVVALASAVALGASSAQAQSPRAAVSFNPFLPLVGYFQGEIEAQVKDNLSFAVAGSHTKIADRYTSAEAKLRFYPAGRALQGFGIAMGAGVGRVKDDFLFLDCLVVEPGRCGPDNRRSEVGPTASVEAQYQRLLGTRRNTAMTVGGGLKRYFVDNTDPNGYRIMDVFVPTLRLTIGYAFR